MVSDRKLLIFGIISIKKIFLAAKNNVKSSKMEGRPTGTIGKRRTSNTRNTLEERAPFVPACDIIAALRQGRNIESLFHATDPIVLRDHNNNPGINLATIQSDFNGNSNRPTNLIAKKSNARLNTTRLEEKEEPRNERNNNNSTNNIINNTNNSNITSLANKLINDEKNGNNKLINSSSQSALRCDKLPAPDEVMKSSSVTVALEDDSNSSKSLDVKKSSSRKPSEKSEKSSRKTKSNSEGKKKRIRSSQTDLSRSDHPAEEKEDEQDAETLELAKLRCTSERTEVIAEREHRRQKRCADYPGSFQKLQY